MIIAGIQTFLKLKKPTFRNNWITERRPWTEEGFSIWKNTKQEGHSHVQTRIAQTLCLNGYFIQTRLKHRELETFAFRANLG